MIAPRLPRIFYGGDYNPEQWPRETWREDARLMRVAGVNLVSLGIFAWAQLEPRPGHYEFDWLDEVMDLLHAHGVMVCLATATASPPPWLARLYPESLPVTADGTTLWPGGRQQYCPSSPAYREAAAALVRRLAARYRDHPALALWHVNNEYGCHVSACYCDQSAAAFRAWLKERYGTIERLNEAWGTAFWSQRYDDWDEINPPRSAPTFANPTQQLDFRRFSSDEILGLFRMERAILREETPDVPATTNFMGPFKPLDYWAWAAEEDVVSNDSYPDPSDPHAHVGQALGYDLMRSLKGGQPWILMEQTTSQVNWRPHNALKRPGQMRLWSMQALARGADGVMFFQWRQSKAGAEKFHGAMVQHAGTDNSRVWREVTALGAELARLEPLVGARMPAEVAIVFDWESWWALELDSHPSRDVRLLDQVMSYYAPLYARNVAVEFVKPDGDLARYRVVLVPTLYQVRPGVAENLARFVQDGGRLVMSFFSGITDENDHILLGGYPAPFRDLLGLRVEEYDPYVPGQTNGLVTPDGARHACDLWSDVIDLEGAEALATYTDDFYAGRAAVTRHAYGEGVAYYVGTRPEEGYLAGLLGRVCAEAGVSAPLEAPAGVEVTRRVNANGSYLFALNHTEETVEVPVTGTPHDVLADMPLTGPLRLVPRGVAILREG